MSTGKKFEVHVQVVLGFDDRDKAIEVAAAFQIATRQLAEADGIPHEISSEIHVRRDDEPPPASPRGGTN